MPAVNQKAGALHVFSLAAGGRSLMTPLGTIPGVTLRVSGALADLIGAADRNGPGKGTLRSEGDGTFIAWRAPGSARFGPAVDGHADGDYLLEDGEDPGKYVQARVKAAYLSPKPVERPVYLQHNWENDWLDVGAEDAAAGVTQVRQFNAENYGGAAISNTRVWVDAAAAYLSIAVDGAGGPFSTPTTEAAAPRIKVTGGEPDGLLRPDALNQGRFWVRRIIPPGAPANPKVLSLLHFSFDGI
jgi:hypothetical protein